MKRAQMTHTGWEHDLQIETIEPPGPPVGNEITIAVEACGVCYRDCIDRAGRFKFINLPVTPGHEAVGRVVEVGPECSEWAVGDRVATMHRGFCGQCGPCLDGHTSLCSNEPSVFGILIDGGYATRLVATERAFYAVPNQPDQMTASEAAVLHCTFGTAYRGLRRGGAATGSGSKVLITGANGGVGSAAIQVARRMGCEVVAVVRDASHETFLRELGAHHVIVDPLPTSPPFHKRLPSGKVDIVLDCVGVSTFNSSLRSLGVGGRLIAIGNIVEERAALNLGLIITLGLQIIGSSGATREDMAKVVAMHLEAPFDAQIHAEMGLEEADRAQRLVRAGGIRGRIVLKPSLELIRDT